MAYFRSANAIQAGEVRTAQSLFAPLSLDAMAAKATANMTEATKAASVPSDTRVQAARSNARITTSAAVMDNASSPCIHHAANVTLDLEDRIVAEHCASTTKAATVMVHAAWLVEFRSANARLLIQAAHAMYQLATTISAITMGNARSMAHPTSNALAILDTVE